MHNYLVIDGMFNGTGVRDYYEGGYIKPSELNLPPFIDSLLTEWLAKYWEEFYLNYADKTAVEKLDIEGEEIAKLIKKELGVKVWYYSDATQQRILI